MNLPTPVYWPDSAVNFLLIGGNDNFRLAICHDVLLHVRRRTDMLRGLSGETSAWKSTLLRRGECRSILNCKVGRARRVSLSQELCATKQQDHGHFVSKRPSAFVAEA